MEQTVFVANPTRLLIAAKSRNYCVTVVNNQI